MQAILTLERAGAQEVVRTLAEYLEAEGYSVTVCAFQNGPMGEEIEKLGVPVEILDRPRYRVVLLPWFLLEMLRLRRQLARLIDRYQIDLIQTHVLNVLGFLVVSLRRTSRLQAVLWTMHNVEFLPKQTPREGKWLHRLKRRGYRLLYRWLSSYVDGFIAVSEEVRQSIIEQVGSVDDKIFTIPNGVDVGRFERPGDRRALCDELGIPIDAHLIATVGRLTEQKGFCNLVDAAKPVVSAFPGTHFLFIGQGELREALMQQAESIGVGDNVHFMGVRRDVPDLLAAVDLFVLPSLWEGLSVALLEAMAAAKPIVATAVSGTVQAMIPGKTGLVVPAGDSQALADAIIQLLSDPVQARSMGQAAREHVANNFGAQKQVAEHLALYHRLLGSGDGR
jgi:glycosyltransferase involved in cell wall biosynthesis